MPGDFLEAAKAKTPSSLLTEWVPKLGLSGGFALDLGCAVGAEAEWLARQGFTVDAIDKSEAMAAAARERCKDLKVSVIPGDFCEFHYDPARYTLITAISSLSFVTKDRCKALCESIKESLRPGGAVIMGFYGIRHAWSAREDMSFWSREELADIWADFQMLLLEENLGTEPLISGEEIFQHRIHLVARKPL